MEATTNILNDRYKLLQQAGSGGMSTVFKGQDLMLGRLVAVKVLHESLTSDPEFLRRFQKEAHAVANLSHPNIVTVHDIGQDNRRYYIVMEYVEGWTLKQLVRRQLEINGSPLSVSIALELAIQICAGIGYAHRANLIHCDVKSQNVLVTQDRIVKVTDFGIARAMSEASLHGEDVVWGTPQYFSPEQAAGEPPTPASDVYSIGVIFFEILTGRLPFAADSHTAMALKHMHSTPPLPSKFNPVVPPQIDQITAKILSKEPTGRYRTADQLGRVLIAYRDNSLQDTGPAAAIERPRSQPAQRKTLEAQSAELAATSFRPSVGNQPLQLPLSESASEFSTQVFDHEAATDWGVVALGLIALFSLLGLIPLWYLVFLRYAG